MTRSRNAVRRQRKAQARYEDKLAASYRWSVQCAHGANGGHHVQVSISHLGEVFHVSSTCDTRPPGKDVEAVLAGLLGDQYTSCKEAARRFSRKMTYDVTNTLPSALAAPLSLELRNREAIVNSRELRRAGTDLVEQVQTLRRELRAKMVERVCASLPYKDVAKVLGLEYEASKLTARGGTLVAKYTPTGFSICAEGMPTVEEGAFSILDNARSAHCIVCDKVITLAGKRKHIATPKHKKAAKHAIQHIADAIMARLCGYHKSKQPKG